ncbi:MAG: ferrous iron transport protein B [Terrimicrobiaceae bacterium]
MKTGTRNRTVRVVLLGNPNTGKSTVFNRLTGLRQHIANYPGVTVDKKVGAIEVGGTQFEVVDLPGCYSLAAASPDERVVLDVLDGRIGGSPPDVIVCVVDATNLRRNLFLVTQAAELGVPMVVALNQWDGARRAGLKIDTALLEERLGVAVIPMCAKKGEGIAELKRAIKACHEDHRYVPRASWPEFLVEARDGLLAALEKDGVSLTPVEALRMMFDADSALAATVRNKELLRAELGKARGILRSHGLNPATAEAGLQYRHLDALLLGVVERDPSVPRSRDTIDEIVLHRFWGTLIFVGVMYLVFQSLYAWAGPFMDLIEMATAGFQEWVGPWFAGTPMLQSLIVDGALAGVGGVIVFLPQILILFLFIALLEDSGYLARAAFLMDKQLGWCGLNGKSFVPMLSGFACAIPAVMAARSLEDPKARITTVFLTPFMSCSARLPVYVLFIGAFVEPTYGPIVAGWTLFAMHFVGAAVALPIGWFLNRVILKIQAQPFILEMPPYRVPTLRNVVIRMWERGREFVVRAGTVILAFSIIIWALLYFPRPEEVADSVRTKYIASQNLSAAEVEEALADPESEFALKLDHQIAGAYIEQSYLGRFGKWVQPVFAPAGFDWKITIGLLSSFPAREVIIATMGIIYNLGADVTEESEDLRSILAHEKWSDGPLQGQPVFTLPVVFALMVFFALCMQCGATVAVVAKELGWKWAVGSFATMTTLAWLAAVLVYQVGSRWM